MFVLCTYIHVCCTLWPKVSFSHLKDSWNILHNEYDEEAEDTVDGGQALRDHERHALGELELADAVDEVLDGGGRQRVEAAADGGQRAAEDPRHEQARQAGDVAEDLHDKQGEELVSGRDKL